METAAIWRFSCDFVVLKVSQSAEGGSDVPNDPVPDDDPVDCVDENDRRLWIGNLDTRVTEYALLKILQKFGSLERFDFLYHKMGPDQGKPRGYCFVSYSTRQEAIKAMKSLDKKLALSKKMIVRWAHKQEEPDCQRVDRRTESAGESLSADSKIRAIEMKLKHMDKTRPDFNLTSQPAQQPGTSKYSSTQLANQQATSNRHSSKPYVRKETKR